MTDLTPRPRVRSNASLVLFLAIGLLAAMGLPAVALIFGEGSAVGVVVGLAVLLPGTYLLARSGVQAVAILISGKEARDPWFGIVAGSTVFAVGFAVWFVLSYLLW